MSFVRCSLQPTYWLVLTKQNVTQKGRNTKCIKYITATAKCQNVITTGNTEKCNSVLG